jgi:glutamate carboxypeptidase
LAPHLERTRVTVEGAIDRPPMPESASAELFALARDLVPGLVGTTVGGGSDGNFTAALGVPTLDGLGAVGGGAHSDHEFVQVDTMATRAHLVAELVGAVRGRRLR